VNLRARSLLATLLATAPLAACGGPTELHSGVSSTTELDSGVSSMTELDSGVSSTELDSGVSSTTGVVHLCDGSAGARLAARGGGGGPIEPGLQMLAENGWEYLIVTGTCETWVLSSLWQPLRHLTLSSEQERALVADLRVGRWSALAARTPPGGSCFDAGSITFRFDQVRYDSSACGLDPADELALVDAAFDQKLQELAGAGAAADGDVRYLVVEDDGSAGMDIVFDNPATWPLGAAPAAVAVTRAQLVVPPFGGRSLRASGDDARALRALRDDFLAGRIGNMMYGGFIPIVTADGMRFDLYVRDVSPFEGADGLIGPGIF
jgi:hypothetical protein